MSNTISPLLKLLYPAFGDTGWNDEVNDNFGVIDALLGNITSLPGFQGAWKNSTAYAVGDKVADVVDGTFWECNVAHTSAASGTFSSDRTANPTYWSNITLTVGSTVGITVTTIDLATATSPYKFTSMPTGTIHLLVGDSIVFTNTADTIYSRCYTSSDGSSSPSYDVSGYKNTLVYWDDPTVSFKRILLTGYLYLTYNHYSERSFGFFGIVASKHIQLVGLGGDSVIKHPFAQFATAEVPSSPIRALKIEFLNQTSGATEPITSGKLHLIKLF